INIKDDTLETIERILSFLYLRDYNKDSLSLLENKLEILELANRVTFNNIKVFIATNKYIILPLKALATLKLS
ncbi:BTB/POZ protein, partial [Penicillium diatomitis]